MASFSKHLYWVLFPVGVIVILDEWIKSIALRRFPDESTIVQFNLLDFAIHKNWGLAFDIPFRREFILLISLCIGFFLLNIAWKNFHLRPAISFASLLIIFGALGNVFDRIVYGFTVDYLIFLGRSAFNLCDIIILAGVLMLLIVSRQRSSTSSA